MVAAWHAARAARLGLFSLDPEEQDEVLAPTEDMVLRPAPPLTEPHDIWIKFLQERIEVAKYCSQDQISVYCDLLQRTLDIQVRVPPSEWRNCGHFMSIQYYFPVKRVSPVIFQ